LSWFTSQGLIVMSTRTNNYPLKLAGFDSTLTGWF